MSIFKAYDIRGIYPDELTEQNIFKIGKAFVKLLKEENPHKQKLKIVVGNDMRLSSPSLKKSLVQAVTSMGADVVDIGLSSTPNYYFAVAAHGYDGGMIISASHNPKEYNGIKIVRAEAKAIGLVNGLDKIEKYSQQEIKEAEVKGKIVEHKGILQERVKFALSFYDFSKIKPLKVVADTANAMGGPELEELFNHLPCELIKMNFKLDGSFPAHQANPLNEENLEYLKKKVLEEKADLGIATDGDADRFFFIDNKGNLVEPAILRGYLAKIILQHNPGSKICYDIRPGKITHDLIVENGGKPIITKVGHTLIKKKAIEEGAEFAGESSGHFFIKTKHGFFETPLIVTLIILNEISKSGKALSEIVAPLRKYSHSGEINFKVQNKEAMIKKIEINFKDAKEIRHLDGLSIIYDNFWFNIRPSNTESLLRLNLEAIDNKTMEEKRDLIIGLIKNKD
ncbi:phosphomannomutase/phosphoglucomutase [Candidatus Woesearchaeota archaeon]|nr:phosphomannomutase/phosphoglucomutase [Candidatus Woesearchaeota archaeon]